MDKIQDFLKELRVRFSSPFFSSFILAWLIINWKVPIALIFYKLPDVQKEEHNTYISLIQQTVTVWSGIIAPVLAAIGYTLIAPLLKNAIRTLYAYLDAKGTDWSLTAAKVGKISVDRYMQLRDSLKTRENALINLYNEESNYLKVNSELHERVADYRTKFENKAANYEELRGYSDVKTYNGHWKLTYADANREQRTNTVLFAMGEVRMTDREGKLLFKITRIGFSSSSQELILTVEDHQQNSSVTFYVVLYCPNQDRMIYINRETGSKIERMERVNSLPKQ